MRSRLGAQALVGIAIARHATKLGVFQSLITNTLAILRLEKPEAASLNPATLQSGKNFY